MSTWRIEDDTLGAVSLTEGFGFVVTSYDLGEAVHREVVDELAGRSGLVDTTAVHGGRIVSLDLALVGPPEVRQANLGMLRAYGAPRRRPRLVWTSEAFDDLRMVGRVVRLTAPAPPAMAPHGCQLQLLVTNGLLESGDLWTTTLIAGSGSAPGRSYDLDYDRDYPSGTPIGATPVVNVGTAPARPLIKIVAQGGSATDPKIENRTVGRFLEFSGLTIPSGDFLEINVDARTILANGNPGASRYDKLAFATSLWWELEPGSNDLRLTLATGAGYAEVSFRPAYY